MMDFLPKEPYKRVFVVVFYATLGCILFYLFFRFFWIPLLPFLIALLLSALIRPIVLFLKKKFRIPTQVGTLLLLLLLIFGILVLLYTATVRLLAEAGKFLASEVPEKAGTSSLTLALQSMLSKWFPGAKKYLESGEIAPEPTPEERIHFMLRHTRMALDSGHYGTEIATMRAMRARLLAYAKGIPGTKAIRPQLSRVGSYAELEDMLLNRFH